MLVDFSIAQSIFPQLLTFFLIYTVDKLQLLEACLFSHHTVTQLRNVLLTLSIVSKMSVAAPRPVAKASRQGDA